MTLFELFELSEPGREWMNGLKTHQEIGLKYEFLTKADFFLSKLDSTQNQVLRSKFTNLGTEWKLYDKIAELFVAIEHSSEQPLFRNEVDGGADIYLKKSDCYLEVKHINKTKEEKDSLKSTKNGYTQNIPVLTPDESALAFENLCTRAKERISKAIEQIGQRAGIVYVVHSLDFAVFFQSSTGVESDAERESRFETYCLKYFKEKANPLLRFKIKNFNELLAGSEI